jgi:hypothetical protein
VISPWRRAGDEAYNPFYMGIPSPAVLALSGRGLADFHAGVNFVMTEFYEVQPRCLGIERASAPFLLRSTRCFSHPSSNHSAASLSSMSSLLRASMCL